MSGVPWVHPALLGALLASALTTARTPLAPPALVVVVAACLAVVAWLAPWPRPWRRAAFACAAAALLAAASAAAWAGRYDAWTPRLGERVEVAGALDGRVLRVAGRDDLLLRGRLPASGYAELTGVLEPLGERRNPGGFDEAGFWYRRSVRAALRVEGVVASPPRGLRALRARLAEGVGAGLPEPSAALLRALTLGLRHDLGDLRATFAAAGLAHVLALSGLHVGVLAGAVALLARPLGARRGALVVLAVVVAYVAVVGPSPSVVRASTMLALAVAARQLAVGRPPLTSATALAALTLLLARPHWVGDLGFQLSFLSVAGIALLAGPLLERVAAPSPGSATGPRRSLRRAGRRALDWTAAGLATSGAAQAATLSLVAGSFGAVPFLAPLTNLVATPLAALLVPLGALAGLAGLVHPSLAALVNLVTAPVAGALLDAARLGSAAPSLVWGEVGLAGHALFAIAIVGLAAGVRGVVTSRGAAAVVLCAALVASSLPDPVGVPEIVVLDVGQGDAVVVRLGRGAAVLVDGGGVSFGGFDAGARVVVPALRALGVWRLPLVVASHPDLDHVGGLPAVLEAFPVGALWFGHGDDERAAWERVLGTAASRGVPLVEVRRGLSASLGVVGLEVLHPTHDPLGEGNADSVALLVRHGAAAWALLLGDVTAAVERDLPVPPTPLLLAPHHGSATSSSEALLRAARPQVALASVGVNRYGHPAASVVARYAEHGVPLVTTRDHGALRHRPGDACVRTELSRPGGASPGTC